MVKSLPFQSSYVCISAVTVTIAAKPVSMFYEFQAPSVKLVTTSCCCGETEVVTLWKNFSVLSAKKLLRRVLQMVWLVVRSFSKRQMQRSGFARQPSGMQPSPSAIAIQGSLCCEPKKKELLCPVSLCAGNIILEQWLTIPSENGPIKNGHSLSSGRSSCWVRVEK